MTCALSIEMLRLKVRRIFGGNYKQRLTKYSLSLPMRTFAPKRDELSICGVIVWHRLYIKVGGNLHLWLARYLVRVAI